MRRDTYLYQNFMLLFQRGNLYFFKIMSCCRAFFENSFVTELLRTFLALKKFEGSLPCSQSWYWTLS